MATATKQDAVLTGDALLAHWQGHRRLTRKTIEVFPEEQLFQFSIGGMRSFGELACEFLGMPLPIVKGLRDGTWERFEFAKPQTKIEVLRAWDAQTLELNDQFPSIPTAQFGATVKAFGQWEMTGIQLVQYAIENEVHHRGQGYVYLRAQGIEPPPFWDRD